jgi:GTP-binding protein
MDIINAKYLISSPNIGLCPKDSLPEVAFIGRSNVGKSSLINMLCKHQGLAKVSSSPGKTSMINHFTAQLQTTAKKLPFFMVDLPGYGFAKVSQNQRKKWGAMIKEYLTQRSQLKCLCVLIDSRVKPQKLDIDFINDTVTWKVPIILIYTKIDKINQREAQENARLMKQILLKSLGDLPPIFFTSAVKGTGRNGIFELWQELFIEFNKQ